MIDYRLLNFAGPKGKAVPAIKVGDEVIDLTIAAPIYARRAKKKLGFEVASTLDILKVWAQGPRRRSPNWRPITPSTTARKAPTPKAVKPLKRVKLLAPILYPSTVFCIAANYADHHAEMGSPTMPDKNVMPPVFFQKTPAQTVVGHGAEIPLPHTSTQIDWEAELAIVIGKPCFNVPKEKVFDYVAGYMVLNDMSIRGPSKADAITPVQKQFRGDRFRRKNFDGSCPTGPWLTPKELVKNPYDLKIQLWVNGELKQNGNSGAMHYNIEEQISYLSDHLTLQPGDVITTGTPAGVGKGKGTYLKAGDKITTTVGNLGTLETSFVPSKKPVKA